MGAILDFAEKMMFARLDFPRFLVCCSGDLSDNESEEKPSVAICGGSICTLTGLMISSRDVYKIVGDAKLHRQTGLGSSFMQSIPTDMLEH